MVFSVFLRSSFFFLISISHSCVLVCFVIVFVRHWFSLVLLLVFFGFRFFSLVFQRFLAAFNVETIHRWRKSEERTPPQKKTKCVQNAGKTFKITSIVDENHEVDVGILNLYLEIVAT